MQEIHIDGGAPVLAWGWFAERFGYDFNGHFFVEDRLAVDPVQMTDEVLARLVSTGVSRIVLTNRNHFRDAARLRAATSARVLVHPADAAFVRERGVPVDGELHEGDTVGPFRVVGCPGKSPGEVLLHDPARRLLVVGDACVGKAPGVLGLLPEAVIDDLPRLRLSLARAAEALDFEALLVGDGHSLLRGGRDALRALVATFPAAASAST